MPPEGLEWLPNPALLTDDEVVRLARIGVQRLGITEVRFTGGEPLLRRGLAGIVAATAALDPAASVLRYCQDRGYQLRFIEQMPPGRRARLAAHRDGHR